MSSSGGGKRKQLRIDFRRVQSRIRIRTSGCVSHREIVFDKVQRVTRSNKNCTRWSRPRKKWWINWEIMRAGRSYVTFKFRSISGYTHDSKKVAERFSESSQKASLPRLQTEISRDSISNSVEGRSSDQAWKTVRTLHLLSGCFASPITFLSIFFRYIKNVERTCEI
jgi:hypothetical protein